MIRTNVRAEDGAPGARASLLEPASLAATALVLLHTVLCWLARPAGILTGQDDVEYLALGQSLRQGGYHLLFRVDAPWHAQYPPGYPAMIAAWGAFFGDGFDAQMALVVLMSAASLAVTYVVVRNIAGPMPALATLAVLAVNPALMRFSSVIATEAPFTLLAVSSIGLTVGQTWSRKRALASGALAIGAALTRSIGIVVPVAIGVHWVLQKRWKAAAWLLAASVVAIGPWLLWTALAPEVYPGHSYMGDLTSAFEGQDSFIRSPLAALFDKVRWLATVAIPFDLAIPTIPGTLVDNVLAALVLWPAVIAGLWLLARKWPAAAAFLLVYGAALVAWPVRVERFVVPSLPFLVPALLLGIGALAARLRTGLRPVVMVLVVVPLLAGSGVRTADMVARNAGCSSHGDIPPARCVSTDQAAYFDALRYVRDEVADDAVFLVAKSGALYHYTGRKSVPLAEALAQPPDRFLPMLSEWGATHILIATLGGGDARTLAPLIESNCEVIVLERKFSERTLLFRLSGESDGDAGEDACTAIREYRSWFRAREREQGG